MAKNKSEIIKAEIKNIGGIEDIKFNLKPGINLLVGENAKNKTSILNGIMAAMGSNKPTLRKGTNKGKATINIKGKKHTNSLKRENGNIIHSNQRDTTKEDLFSFLIEENETRQAVERRGDLRNIVLKPIDIEKIENKEKNLRNQKFNLRDELKSLKEKKKELQELKSKKKELENEIKQENKKLKTKEKEIEKIEKSLEDVEEKKKKETEKTKKLENLKAEKKRKESSLNIEKEKVERIENEIRSREKKLKDIEVKETNDLKKKGERLNKKERSLENEISKINRLIELNKEKIEEAKQKTEIIPEVDCWSCGRKAKLDVFENMIEELKEERKQKNKDRKKISKERKEIENKINRVENMKKEKGKLENNLKKKERKKKRSEEKIESMKKNIEDISKKISKLSKNIEDTKIDEDIPKIYREYEQLKSNIEQKNENLEEINNKINKHKDIKENIQDIEEKIDNINKELKEIRNKIKRKEQTTVNQFNKRMGNLSKYLGEDLKKIWIERIVDNNSPNQYKDNVKFKLKIKRENGEKDNIDNLSESERESIGLILGLSGYLAYEMETPLLLDSLGMFDSKRLKMLLQEFKEETEFVIAAILPEEEKNLDVNYNKIEL